MKRLFGVAAAAILTLLVYIVPVETRSIHGTAAPTGVTSFSTLKLGNGGLVTQVDMKADGSKAASGDSTGGWVWSIARNEWVDTLITTSMPAGTLTQDTSSGADKLVIDPNTTTTLWMLFNGRVYKTTNSGTTWLDASSGYAPAQIRSSSNTNTSALSQYAAVDPNNSNIVYFSSPSAGSYRTTNGTAAAASVVFSKFTTLGGGLPMRSGNVLTFPISTTSASSVNLGTVNGTTITINKSRFTSSVAFTTASPTITLTVAIPAWVSRQPYTDIWDVTTGTKVGIACGYAGSVITLCANSAINSSGASDTLALSYPRFNAETVQVWQTSAPTNQFYGTIVSDNTTVGTITINVNYGVLGSGTATDWSVGFAGSEGFGGGHRFVFDISGGTTASCAGGLSICTKNVYLHTYGIGTYKSIDGGQTWALMVEANAPDAVYHMTISPNGTLWVQNHMYPGSPYNNVQKFVPGAPGVWTAQTISGSWLSGGIAVDPLNCATEATCRVAVADNSGPIWYSTNAGAASPTWNNSGTRTYSSTGDVSWVTPDWNVLFNVYFAGTTLAFDPSSAGTLYRIGEGVWKTTNPPTSAGAAITYSQQSRGIEMFVLNQVISPVGASGSAFITTWDMPCFYSETFTAYPTASSCFTPSQYRGLMKAYSSDWFPQSSGTPGVVALVNNGNSTNDMSQDYSGISLDKGKPSPSAWTQFNSYTASGSFAFGAITITLTASVPAGVTAGQFVYDNSVGIFGTRIGTVLSKAGSTITLAAGSTSSSAGVSDNLAISPFDKTGGCIAASTNGTVLVRFNQNTGSNLPYISTDSGQTWAAITLPVAFSSGWGNPENYLSYTKFCDSDKTNGDIYIYSPYGVTALYRYNAATTAWTYQGAPNFSNGYLNGQMKTVYNKTGHLFFSSGQSGPPHGSGVNYFYFSNNQGVTWTVVPTFNEVGSYAIGKEASGATYPTLYVSGYRSGVQCIWRSTNWDPNNVAAATWTCIGQYPNGSSANLTDMDADKSIYGQFYGVNGKQAFVGVIN